MATKIYGASDDLIEFEGDIHGEVSHYESGRDEEEAKGCLLIFDDGTMVVAKYGKALGAIWALTVERQGSLFDRLEVCSNEDANPHSDVLHLKDGAKLAIAAKQWERVK